MHPNPTPFQRALPSGGNWPRSLLVSAGLFLLIALVSELRARRAGYQTQFPYVDDIWVSQWYRLDRLPEDQTVLLGASRMNFGIDLDTWEKRTGERPLMLAWPGCPFLPALHALAQRRSFRGTVYCNVSPSFVFSGETHPWVVNMNRIVGSRDIKRISLNFIAGERLRTALYGQLRILNAGAFSPLENARQAFRLPDRENTHVPLVFPFHCYLRGDLQLQFIAEAASDRDLQRQLHGIFLGAMASQRAHGPCDMDQVINQIVADVHAIKARGGNVVFVRLPSDGGYRTFESKYYPRESYWDRLPQATGCLSIHFQDYPELRDYRCVEWSHLDVPDAIRFTHDFLDIVNRQRVD